MSERPPEETAEEPQDATPTPEDDSPGLGDDFIYEVEDAIGSNNTGRFEMLVAELHAADLADLIEYLTRDERQQAVEWLGTRMDPEVLVYLDAAVREEVIEQLGPRGLAQALSALDSDDAVEVFEDLEEEFQYRILASLPAAYRALLEESLSYPEDSAGGPKAMPGR